MESLQANIDAIVSGGGVTIGLQTFTGGKVASSPARTRDPGSRFDRPIAAPPTLEPITCGVDYDEAKHGNAKRVWRALVGTDSPFSVGHIIRDGAGNRIGMDTYTCIITGVTPPEGDVNGGNNKAVLTLEFEPSGVA